MGKTRGTALHVGNQKIAGTGMITESAAVLQFSILDLIHLDGIADARPS
jgi:hypothetical protein